MAYYALWQWFHTWSKRNYPHMIIWYRDKLHQDWLNSLTNEQREIYEKHQENERIKHRNNMRVLMNIMNILNSSAIEKYGMSYTEILGY